MNEYIKLSLCGGVLLILVGVSCYFWYQWQTQPYRQEYAKTQQLVHKRTAQHTGETSKTSDPEQKQDGTPVKQMPVPAEHPTDKTHNIVEDANPDKTSTRQPQQGDVSPYGFGAYPQIPASWPQDVQFFPANSIEHELMLRVEIELTNQGIEVMGSTMENGRVYPTINGRVYVRWTDDPRFGRYISEVGGHPDTAMQFEMLLETFEEQSDRNFRVSDAPPDIEIVDYDDSGIEPYSFLGL